jgi:hypothetical protein
MIKTTLQSLYNIRTAANPQGRLAKKNVFIGAHRFLLVEQEASDRSPFQPDKAILRYTDTITKCHNTLYGIQ